MKIQSQMRKRVTQFSCGNINNAFYADVDNG